MEQGTTKGSSLTAVKELTEFTKADSLKQGTTKWSSLTLVKELGQSKSLQLHYALLGLDSLEQGTTKRSSMALAKEFTEFTE